jgi:DNA-binding GntR family transcriptional regulator
MMNKRSLSDAAYERLLSQLLRNELTSGDFINRRALAAEIDSSVAPVLEAVLKLQSEGFLEALPRKGTRVRMFKKDDIVGHLILREALECQAARIYCGDGIMKNRKLLLSEAEKLDAIPEGTYDDFKEEIEFHTRLVKLSGCRPLYENFIRAANISLFCSLNILPTIGVPVVKNNHSDLISSLMTSDPDKAETAMRMHLRKGKGNIFDNI